MFEPGEPAPGYVESIDFVKFQKAENIMLNEKYGYIYIHTYKPFYFPGEIIRGSILLDIFNPLPKNCRQLQLRFTGREMVGKHFQQVKDSLINQKKKNMKKYSTSNVREDLL